MEKGFSGFEPPAPPIIEGLGEDMLIVDATTTQDEESYNLVTPPRHGLLVQNPTYCAHDHRGEPRSRPMYFPS